MRRIGLVCVVVALALPGLMSTPEGTPTITMAEVLLVAERIAS